MGKRRETRFVDNGNGKSGFLSQRTMSELRYEGGVVRSQYKRVGKPLCLTIRRCNCSGDCAGYLHPSIPVE